MLAERRCQNLQQQLRDVHQELRRAQCGNRKMESALKSIYDIVVL